MVNVALAADANGVVGMADRVIALAQANVVYIEHDCEELRVLVSSEDTTGRARLWLRPLCCASTASKHFPTPAFRQWPPVAANAQDLNVAQAARWQAMIAKNQQPLPVNVEAIAG
jgi:hypothetical protein